MDLDASAKNFNIAYLPNNYYAEPLFDTSYNERDIIKDRINKVVEYVILNPDKSGLFLNRLIGIDTERISLEYFEKLASSKNKQAIFKEVAWLYENADLIATGEFKDRNYSKKRNSGLSFNEKK